jgi:spore germination protein KB
VLAEVSGHNSWLTVLATIIPGLLLIYVYCGLLKKSSQPFPQMLEEHLGIAGRIIALFYVLVFLLLASLYLRFFVEFLSITVLHNTPTGLIIMALLIPGVYTIRSSLEVFARVSEVILWVFLPLAMLMLLVSSTEHPDIGNLMPLAFMGIKDFIYSVYLNLWHFANIIIILTLAYFSLQREQIPRLLLTSLVSLALFLALSIMVVIITLGAALASSSTFPLFEIARSASYAGFIRNTEPIFVSIFMLGLYVSVVSFLFIACYSTQQVFRLKDYRFLAIPSTLLVAFHSLLIGPSTATMFKILHFSAPLIFGFFFVLIPILLYILLLFRPHKVNLQSGSGLQSPET